MVSLLKRGTLHFALLGTPQVYQDGQLLVFPSHKALALLLYLAVEQGSHSRKTLSELFWPESDAAHARSALRTTVVELRDVLAEEPSPAQRTGAHRIPHLLIDRDSLSLDATSQVSLDLDTLQAAWVLARDAARVAVPLSEETRRAHLVQLQEATTLVRGEFLDGFSLHNVQGFDDWTRFQREYWHLRMHLVFDRLSTLYEAVGEFEQAIAVIIRWLALTFLNEEASQRLMRLHFAVGNRVAALQAYEVLRALLASEIHTEPTPSTMALAERIRATSPARHIHQATRRTSPFQSLLAAPFVGRTREYGLLLEQYYLTRQGQTQVVLVEGEAGIGKTRLATEFLDWAVAQGADVLRGQAFESNRRLSYQPFIEALRPRIDQENAPEDLLHDVWLAELARLLPELHERYPDLTRGVVDASVARNHLFEAVTRLLTVLAARTPLILFLDDLHWADTATLDLLHYLARRFTAQATPILLLLCLRTEARQTPFGLTEWRANLGRILPLTRLSLGSLSAQDTVNLLHILARRDQGGEASRTGTSGLVPYNPADILERVGQQLFAETHGQPFYLIETLKLLLAHGLFLPSFSSKEDSRTEDIAATLVKELGIARLFPPSVRELISIQLDRLRPAAFAFLVAGAVLEHDATFERLCSVADLSEHEGLVALDEVLRSLLVQEPKLSSSLGGSAVYTFTNPLIRDVVSVEAGETRSRIFHRRALHLLQDASVPVAKLAYHALSAGMLDPAFRLSVAAGDEARAVFALPVAIEHYEQAWQLLATQRMDSLNQAKIASSDVYHLYVVLGHAYELTRTWEQARPLYAAMLDYLLKMVTQEDETSRVAKTQWYQAMLDLSTADLSMAISYGECALAVARSSGQPEMIAQSLNMLTSVMMQIGAWEEYEHHVTEVLAYYVTLQDRAMEADALCMLAHTHLHRGQLHLGITHARRALKLSQEIRNTWGQVNALYDLTSGLLDSGAYTEALESALQAVASARTLNRGSARANTLLLRALIQLGGVYRAMQAGSAALTVDLEALMLNETLRSSSYTAVVTSVLCVDYVLTGEWVNAERYARQATMIAGEHELVYVEIPHWCVTEVLLRGGDAMCAKAHLAQLNAHNGDGRRDRVQYLRASAKLAVWEGRGEQARSHLEEARVLAEEIGLSDERWQIQVALGDLDQSRGESAQADQVYVQAVSVVQALAERIEDEVLRTHFLTAPQVQRVLEHVAR